MRAKRSRLLTTVAECKHDVKETIPLEDLNRGVFGEKKIRVARDDHIFLK